jgi:hypothetical protein
LYNKQDLPPQQGKDIDFWRLAVMSIMGNLWIFNAGIEVTVFDRVMTPPAWKRTGVQTKRAAQVHTRAARRVPPRICRAARLLE